MPTETARREARRLAGWLVLILVLGGMVIMGIGYLRERRFRGDLRDERDRSDAALTKEVKRLTTQIDETREKATFGSCRSGNLVRAYLVVRAAEFPVASDKTPALTTKLAPQIFPLIACDYFAKTGERKPLTETVQAQFLEMFKKGLWPTVENGKITGSVPFKLSAP